MKYFASILLVLTAALSFYFLNNALMEKANVTQELHMNVSSNANSVKNIGKISEYSAIVERPLFIEERRFEKEQQQKVIRKATPVVQDLKVQALGIALTGEGIIAVLKDLSNGKIYRLRIGEEIYGWSLKSVSHESFTFVKGEAEKLIKFKV